MITVSTLVFYLINAQGDDHRLFIKEIIHMDPVLPVEQP